ICNAGTSFGAKGVTEFASTTDRSKFIVLVGTVRKVRWFCWPSIPCCRLCTLNSTVTEKRLDNLRLAGRSRVDSINFYKSDGKVLLKLGRYLVINLLRDRRCEPDVGNILNRDLVQGFLDHSKLFDLRIKFENSSKEMNDHMLARPRSNYVRVASDNLFEQGQRTSTFTHSIERVQRRKISQVIPNEWHGIVIESCHDDVSEVSRGYGLSLIIKDLQINLWGHDVIIQAFALSSDHTSLGAAV